MELNKQQIAAVAERLLYIAVSFLTSYGHITKEDEASFVAVGLAIVGAGIGWFNNRKSRLADRAMNVNKDAVIVGSQKLADDTKSDRIVSENKVVVVAKP